MSPHDNRSHEFLIMLATFHNGKSRFNTSLDLDEAHMPQRISRTFGILEEPWRRKACQKRSVCRGGGKARHPFAQVSDIRAAAALRLQTSLRGGVRDTGCGTAGHDLGPS